MASSSPPPLRLLELQGEIDLPAAPNSGRGKHPESKQGRKAAGPGHAGCGSGQAVPCPPPPGQSSHARPVGRVCAGPGVPPWQAWARQEVAAGLGMTSRCPAASQGPASCYGGKPPERNQSHMAGCNRCFSQVGEQPGTAGGGAVSAGRS